MLARPLAILSLTRPALGSLTRPSRSINMKAGDRGMSSDERFLFDLNGFLVLRGILSPEEVAAANAAVDAKQSLLHARDTPALRNTKPGSPLDASGPRLDMGGMLFWEQPHCDVFRTMLCHPKLVPYLTELCGLGYRLDHQPLLLAQERDSEGFSLHGGPISSDGRFNPTLQYRCEQGQLWTSLLAVSYQLCDHNPGDGGFCVVRGSHKLNVPCPTDFATGASAEFREHMYQPVTQVTPHGHTATRPRSWHAVHCRVLPYIAVHCRALPCSAAFYLALHRQAGDVVIWSEATIHGATPWRGAQQRRLALYRFAPANMGYGRGYLEYPEAQLRQMTPMQRAVLEPPYADRLDRPLVTPRQAAEDPEGEMPTMSRNDEKRKLDEVLFGTKYF